MEMMVVVSSGFVWLFSLLEVSPSCANSTNGSWKRVRRRTMMWMMTMEGLVLIPIMA